MMSCLNFSSSSRLDNCCPVPETVANGSTGLPGKQQVSNHISNGRPNSFSSEKQLLNGNANLDNLKYANGQLQTSENANGAVRSRTNGTHRNSHRNNVIPNSPNGVTLQSLKESKSLNHKFNSASSVFTKSDSLTVNETPPKTQSEPLPKSTSSIFTAAFKGLVC